MRYSQHQYDRIYDVLRSKHEPRYQRALADNILDNIMRALNRHAAFPQSARVLQGELQELGIQALKNSVQSYSHLNPEFFDGLAVSIKVIVYPTDARAHIVPSAELQSLMDGVAPIRLFAQHSRPEIERMWQDQYGVDAVPQ